MSKDVKMQRIWAALNEPRLDEMAVHAARFVIYQSIGRILREDEAKASEEELSRYFYTFDETDNDPSLLSNSVDELITECDVEDDTSIIVWKAVQIGTIESTRKFQFVPIEKGK